MESENPKVDMPNLITYLNDTPLLEEVCGSTWLQEEIRKDMRSKEIGMHAQDMRTVLDSIVNTIRGDLHDFSMSTRIFTLTTTKLFIQYDQ